MSIFDNAPPKYLDVGSLTKGKTLIYNIQLTRVRNLNIMYRLLSRRKKY